MKKLILFAMLGLFLQVSVPVEAQILKKIVKKVKKKADQKVNKGIDKSIEEVEGVFDEKKSDSLPDKKIAKEKVQDKKYPSDGLTLNWSKYDFVPGDKIIFEDNLINEENGEFPSRWDLKQGNVEIAQLGDENVIMFRAGSPEIIPYLKNPEKDYLPDIFTIEFDLYCGRGTFEVQLYDRKNQKSGSPSGFTELKINNKEMGWCNNFSKIPDQSLPERRWVHVAIAYTNGKLKAYHDETRLINIPRIDFNPKGITLYTYIFGTLNEGHYYVKNLRIAEGGVKYYDRFLQDGKIVTTGIKFDSGKATLKPESMGVINEIAKLMKQHPGVKFSIEGHTDSDGDAQFNKNLSEQRAIIVMHQLIEQGIAGDRMVTKGFGEDVPVADNSTAEGKANNRRVEFVKISDVG